MEHGNVDLSVERWERLILSNNDEQIWRAINWKGEFQQSSSENICPDDNEFKEMFEDKVNPPAEQNLVDEEYMTNVSIPLLDEPITPSSPSARGGFNAPPPPPPLNFIMIF